MKNVSINRKRLAELVRQKQEDLGLTQREMADYYSEVTGHKVSYGFFQTLYKEDRNSVPDLINMIGISKMLGVTLDELYVYLTDDSVQSLKDVSAACEKLKNEYSKHPDNILEIVKNAKFDEKLKIYEALHEDIVSASKKGLALMEKLRQIDGDLN